jgi:hypothetical protein
MKDERIKILLRQISPSPEPSGDCPDEQQFASYTDGGLSEKEHQELSHHIADCDYCLLSLGALGRARDTDAAVPVPELIKARARKLVPGGSIKPPIWRQAPRWAAAAALVLALGLLFTAGNRQWLPGSAPGAASAPAAVSDERQTRYIEPLASGPSILWPREGVTLELVDHVFSWTAVPDCLFYDLRIVSDEGDLVWQERLTQTRWNFPTALRLRRGDEYFVRIDAWLDDTKSLSSDYVLFRYGDQH